MVPTLKQFRLQAHLSIAELARIARVDRGTVERAERGKAVQDAKAYAIVDALSEQLNRKIVLSEIDGLNIM